MSTKSKAISIRRGPARRRQAGFVLCVDNKGYEVSLERRKIYEALADEDAATHGQLRVIDESGDDYLFPSTFFVAIEVPVILRKHLRAAV